MVREADLLQNGLIFVKVPKGGGGVIFNPKIYIADFCHCRLYFGHEFRKNLQYDFPKMRGGGVKGRLELSKNSSVLEVRGFP